MPPTDEPGRVTAPLAIAVGALDRWPQLGTHRLLLLMDAVRTPPERRLPGWDRWIEGATEAARSVAIEPERWREARWWGDEEVADALAHAGVGGLEVGVARRVVQVLLSHPAPAVRRTVALAVATLPPELRDEARELVLADWSPEVRRLALGGGRVEVSERVAERLLRDPDAQVRAAAVWRLPPRQIERELRRLVRDEASPVRAEVALRMSARGAAALGEGEIRRLVGSLDDEVLYWMFDPEHYDDDVLYNPLPTSLVAVACVDEAARRGLARIPYRIAARPERSRPVTRALLAQRDPWLRLYAAATAAGGERCHLSPRQLVTLWGECLTAQPMPPEVGEPGSALLWVWRRHEVALRAGLAGLGAAGRRRVLLAIARSAVPEVRALAARLAGVGGRGEPDGGRGGRIQRD